MGEIAETTGLLFGSCWPEFTDQQFKHSVELFRKRALANKFDLSWIKNKTCIIVAVVSFALGAAIF